jgi:alkylated DNA repair dioxygenase AlkB
MARDQHSLFGDVMPGDDGETRTATPPAGFRYRRDLLAPEVETQLLGAFASLPFRNFEFHGYVGKRRVVSFGWRYDFSKQRAEEADPIPDFLLPVRDLAAQFAGTSSDQLVQALVTEYSPGASIGWHRDKQEFGDVLGISLLSSCVFRLRRKKGPTWERYSILAEPRSVYLMSGPSRMEWEHSIPAVDSLRYSITFRTLRGARARDVRGSAPSGGIPGR